MGRGLRLCLTASASLTRMHSWEAAQTTASTLASPVSPKGRILFLVFVLPNRKLRQSTSLSTSLSTRTDNLALYSRTATLWPRDVRQWVSDGACAGPKY